MSPAAAGRTSEVMSRYAWKPAPPPGPVTVVTELAVITAYGLSPTGEFDLVGLVRGGRKASLGWPTREPRHNGCGPLRTGPRSPAQYSPTQSTEAPSAVRSARPAGVHCGRILVVVHRGRRYALGIGSVLTSGERPDRPAPPAPAWVTSVQPWPDSDA